MYFFKYKLRARNENRLVIGQENSLEIWGPISVALNSNSPNKQPGCDVT